MSKKYVVWTRYWNGTGATETFRSSIVAWLYAREKRHQGFKVSIEKRDYEVDD